MRDGASYAQSTEVCGDVERGGDGFDARVSGLFVVAEEGARMRRDEDEKLWCDEKEAEDLGSGFGVYGQCEECSEASADSKTCLRKRQNGRG